jgi:hypothetical protein
MPVETLAEWAVKPWSSRLEKMAQPGIPRRNIYGGRLHSDTNNRHKQY